MAQYAGPSIGIRQLGLKSQTLGEVRACGNSFFFLAKAATAQTPTTSIMVSETPTLRPIWHLLFWMNDPFFY